MTLRDAARGAATAALIVSASTASFAQDTVRIGLAVAQNAGYVQFYAAEALGFYKEAGLKAEITTYRGGAASQEAMSAGAADIITYFGAGVGLAVSKGAKEKIVATIDSTPHGWHFLVLANSPIKSLKDIDGKKVGVATKAGTADMFALWIADTNGVKVQTIPVGGGGMAPALTGNQVDAVAMFPPYALRLQATGQARSLFDFGKDMVPTMPDVIVASQVLMDKNPKAVRGTLAALHKALAHMRANREWGLKYLKDFTKETDDKINAMVFDQVVMQLSRDGVTQSAWLKSSLDIAAKVWGQAELARLKPEDLYTNAFLTAQK